MGPSISFSATLIASDPIRPDSEQSLRERSSAEIHNSIALNMPPPPTTTPLRRYRIVCFCLRKGHTRDYLRAQPFRLGILLLLLEWNQQ